MISVLISDAQLVKRGRDAMEVKKEKKKKKKPGK
jgi:hypothetical protein